jgi:hypothetical protein
VGGLGLKRVTPVVALAAGIDWKFPVAEKIAKFE